MIHMQTTFFIGLVFPPPSACSQIFTRFYSSCTWFTSYTWISFVVEFVIWDVVCFYVIPSLFPCPVKYRIKFYHTIMLFVNFNFFCCASIFCFLDYRKRDSCRLLLPFQ